MLGFIGKQFIDVIEWTDPADGILAYRVPFADNEIQNGARLTVRESQCALFIDEGRIADVFTPGNYRLTTQTLPVLTNLRNWDKAFASPFKSDVVYFSTRDQLDQRWGTATPIAVRDREFGSMHVRAHGTFAYKVSDPTLFFKRVSGTRETYTAGELEGQLRSIVLTTLASVIGTGEVAFLDMAAHQNQFSQVLRAGLAPAFADYGLALTAFNVQSISLPDDVQAHLNRGTSMRLVGDLDSYVKFQAADSLMKTGAGSADGVVQTGVGLGAGAALGQALARSLTPGGPPDVLATIARLHDLLKQGALTQDEFDAQKTALLKQGN